MRKSAVLSAVDEVVKPSSVFFFFSVFFIVPAQTPY